MSLENIIIGLEDIIHIIVYLGCFVTASVVLVDGIQEMVKYLKLKNEWLNLTLSIFVLNAPLISVFVYLRNTKVAGISLIKNSELLDIEIKSMQSFSSWVIQLIFSLDTFLILFILGVVAFKHKIILDMLVVKLLEAILSLLVIILIFSYTFSQLNGYTLIGSLLIGLPLILITLNDYKNAKSFEIGLESNHKKTSILEPTLSSEIYTDKTIDQRDNSNNPVSLVEEVSLYPLLTRAGLIIVSVLLLFLSTEPLLKLIIEVNEISSTVETVSTVIVLPMLIAVPLLYRIYKLVRSNNTNEALYLILTTILLNIVTLVYVGSMYNFKMLLSSYMYDICLLCVSCLFLVIYKLMTVRTKHIVSKPYSIVLVAAYMSYIVIKFL